jgi:chromosome segregation ATPase
MHRYTSAPSAMEVYTQQQRQRLESIKQATERERRLLQERASSPVPTADSYGSPAAHRSMVQMERDNLHARSEELGQQMAKIRAEEHDLGAEEHDIDRRLAKAEDRKRDLLATLSSLQFREADLHTREEALEARETALKAKQDEVRQRERIASSQQGSVKSELAQREAQLAATQKKIRDKMNDDQRISMRFRQQLTEHESRIRGQEMQLNVRIRSIEDLERQILRDEMRQRDDEAHAIEELRRDIDHRRTVLTSVEDSFQR